MHLIQPAVYAAAACTTANLLPRCSIAWPPLQEVADLIERCMRLEVSERPTAQQLMLQLEELSERGRFRQHTATSKAAAVAAAVIGKGGGPGKSSAPNSRSPGSSRSPAAGSGSPAATWNYS